MATEASACHGNPNFAVICSFLHEYTSILGIEEIAFDDLQLYLEDNKRGLYNFTVRISLNEAIISGNTKK